jgi:hypothetical protein
MFDQLDEQQKTRFTKDSAQCVCYDHERSTFDRPALWIPTVIAMFASFFLLFVLADLPYGIQIGSLFPYTAFVALGTFSAQRGMQPYFFECPIVQQTMPRLWRRHGGFLISVVLVETIALYMKRYMPSSWLTATGKDGSPFGISLWIVCGGLAFVQVFTNRSLLERAHSNEQSEDQ